MSSKLLIRVFKRVRLISSLIVIFGGWMENSIIRKLKNRIMEVSMMAFFVFKKVMCIVGFSFSFLFLVSLYLLRKCMVLFIVMLKIMVKIIDILVFSLIFRKFNSVFVSIRGKILGNKEMSSILIF